MKINLRPAARKFVQEQLKVGNYVTADELINEAIAQMRAQNLTDAEKLENLRREIEPALAELDRGNGKLFRAAEIKRQGRRLLAQRRRRAG